MTIDGQSISKNLCAEVIGESVPPKLIEIICNQIEKDRRIMKYEKRDSIEESLFR